MTLAKGASRGLIRTRSLLRSLIELPDLATTIRTLPAHTFAALVRKVGVQDAGELVALATTEQLVHAFDEDLFVSDRAGERESLDVGRFVVWLEVLMEAGDDVAADRVAGLDEDFVAHALAGVLLVLDEGALRDRLEAGDEDEARQVDKSLESALTEEIDGYILVAKQPDGWDAVLALVLALDRNHRALLVRLLDRLSLVGSAYLDDLEELSTVLSEGESLAEDVEAAREERRGQQGYVDARSARAFLLLARKPPADEERPTVRDPLTRAYFREVERRLPKAMPGQAAHPAVQALPPTVLLELDQLKWGGASPALTGSSTQMTTIGRFTEALRQLSLDEPALFSERMEEFAYLTNVLIAGHDRDGSRLRLEEATDTALATVCYGATIDVQARRAKARLKAPPSRLEFVQVLRQQGVDILFRVASGALAAGAAPKVESATKTGLLYSADELEAALG
ncbi:MAG TPA: DUF6178 family protein [Polyangiaceae bacterium]|nr:DUF6178 family protein [Polyangiaceae bacterium]